VRVCETQLNLSESGSVAEPSHRLGLTHQARSRQTAACFCHPLCVHGCFHCCCSMLLPTFLLLAAAFDFVFVYWHLILVTPDGPRFRSIVHTTQRCLACSRSRNACAKSSASGSCRSLILRACTSCVVSSSSSSVAAVVVEWCHSNILLIMKSQLEILTNLAEIQSLLIWLKCRYFPSNPLLKVARACVINLDSYTGMALPLSP
jgi:hypothetical protein